MTQPPPTRIVHIGKTRLGGDEPLMLIAGPCVIESEASCRRHAERLAELGDRLDIPVVFKSSYDKANRTALENFRGPGPEEGLRILADIAKATGLPVLTDVHSPEEAELAGRFVDCVQIPALLCRQTDLLLAAGQTGKAVNIKKGQFLAPHDIQHPVDKVRSTGNNDILVTERGVMFGYNQLINDMRALPIMRQSGQPVVFDATHSVQTPSGLGSKSGGQRDMVPYLAQAAAGAGIDGLFLEVHEDPDKAQSDGPCMVPMNELEPLLRTVMQINEIVRERAALSRSG